MQVARAAASQLQLSPTAAASGPLARSSNAHVPLYLSTTLRDIAFDLEELEGVSLDRLAVLKAADAARTAALTTASSAAAKLETVRSAVRAAERSHGLNIPPPTNPERSSRLLKDEASHFLLRLALCREHEHRSWLLATECDLFAMRLHGAGVDLALEVIRRANGPHVRPVPPSELERDPALRAALDAVQRGPNRARSGDPPPRYYTLAFEHVPSLVRTRRVLLRAGLAYVAEHHVLDVVAAQFRMKLSAGLQTAARAVALADADPRMRPILQSIRDHYAASTAKRSRLDEARDTDKISLNELSDALPAMPLCMQNMMAQLRRQHHMRHAGRMQLGVFLKGCGLSMDESLRFWRDEFGKGDITAEKFEKNYAYNIRHHYGKEGKRRNLTPFSCMRVINERPGPGEHHGCPYREFDEHRLAGALRAAGADPNTIAPIVARAKDNNYQAACGMCFAATQPGHHGITEGGMPEYIPNHPNEYFIEGRRRHVAPQGGQKADVDEELDDETMLQAALAAESQLAESQEAATPEPGSDDSKPDRGEKDMDVDGVGTLPGAEGTDGSNNAEKNQKEGSSGESNGLLEHKAEDAGEREAKRPKVDTSTS